jgi:hypothetical protein
MLGSYILERCFTVDRFWMCYGWVFVFSAKLIQCDGICEYYDYLIEPSLEAFCFP